MIARGYWHTENGFDALAGAVVIPDEPVKRKAIAPIAPIPGKACYVHVDRLALHFPS